MKSEGEEVEGRKPARIFPQIQPSLGELTPSPRLWCTRRRTSHRRSLELQ